MKLKFLMLAMMLALASLARGATNDLTGLLQKGLFEEEANRALTAAIANYQSLANAFDKDRQLAATAIFRLGECYRKLGKTNDAAAEYQRIIKEFSDQQTLVTLSRQNLAGLNVAATSANSGGTAFSFAESEANVASLQAQIQEIKKLPHDQARIYVQQNFPNPVLTTLVQELDLAQQSLINLKTDYTPDHPKYKSAQAQVDDLNRKVDEQAEGVLLGLQSKLEAAQAQLALLGKRQSDEASGGGESETLLRLQIERARQQIADYENQEKELLKLYLPDNSRVRDLRRQIDSENAKLAALTEKLKMAQGVTAEGGNSITDEEQQEIRRIQLMIQNSPDLINAPDGDGNTPLLLAASKGQLVVAKYLLDHGADVNGRNNRHVNTPLSVATENGHKAMVELLLARGAEVNGNGGRNPLVVAVRKGYVAVAEVLLANKADVNTRFEGGALNAAAGNGQTELLKLLIEQGAEVNLPDSEGRTPLEMAAMQNNTNAAKLLLGSKAAVEAKDRSGNTPLHEAAKAGNAEFVSLLLESRAAVDPTNSSDATPLLLAVVNNRTDAVRVLLQHKADPNREGVAPNPFNPNEAKRSLPILFAIWRGDDNIVKLLLDAGANPEKDSQYEVPLFTAITYNRVDAVQILLEHGADPNRVVKGIRPLNHALRQKKDARIAHLLLDKGADANAADSEGGAPLFCTSDPEVGHWLIDHKADVNARFSSAYTTALMAARDTNYIRFLLEAGAKPDLQDTNGNTALHYFTSLSNPEAVAVALEYKANPNIQNEWGFTPLDIAKSGEKGTIPARVFANYGPYNVNADNEKKIAELLVQAGGLANLPKRNRIEVRRASLVAAVLTKDSQGWNRYSLLETVARTYGFISQSTSGDWSYNNVVRSGLWDQYLRFPDFKNVVIYRREGASAKQKAINVNVEEILNSGDCSEDVWLEWGDVVEIPEADHPVDQHWDGPGERIVTSLTNCVAREVTINIKGASTVVKLCPELEATSHSPGLPQNDSMKMVHVSFMLRSVLDNSKLVRVSSDLSRVKVTRMDPQTKKKQEWTIDCTNPAQYDFWLRNGDVIDVPEK